MPTNGSRSEKSWPEEAPENPIISNPDDDEDDDDFEDEIWYQDLNNHVDGVDNMMEHYIPLTPQDPNDDDDSSNNGVSYRQQYRVEWISTDQPLFDRELFESQRESNNSNSNSNDNSVTDNDSRETPGESSQTTTSAADDGDQMDKEKIETIKNLMANFKLPDENYPNWAKNIPEEEWKNHLKKI